MSTQVRLAALGRSLEGLHKKLVLTYDNTVATDGVGAQLHRIYGVYSIARLLGASYLHSPLDRVDYQGLSALQQNVANPDFHQEFNDLFQIPSDVLPSDDFYHIRLRGISMEVVHQLVALFDSNGTGGRPCLLRLAMPQGSADQFPDCFELCKKVSPFAPPVRDGRPWRVVVHVRRGELFFLATDRMLPNAYYISVALGVARALEVLKIDYQIELCTEVPTKEFMVQPGQHGIFERLSAPVVVRPEMCRLEEFDVLPNLVRSINGRAIDCIRGLATADVLVMSRSSFSYLGAILNRTGTVLYHPFWHRAPSSWITVDPDGHFDEVEFQGAVTRY